MPDPHPITLTVTTGRSGTRFLCQTFRASFAGQGTISHEFLHPRDGKPAVYLRSYDAESQAAVLANPVVRALLENWRRAAESGPVVDFGFTLSGLIPAWYRELGNRLHALVVHRHPVEVAASFAVRGHYRTLRSPDWAVTPMHARVRFPEFRARWERMTPFEKGLYRWLETTAYGLELGERYPSLPRLVVASRDLFGPGDALPRVAAFCGFPAAQPLTRAADRNVRQVHHIERFPVGEEWQRYRRHPEVVAQAEALGYDMSERAVERIVGKYRLPPGPLPWLRHRSGYWFWRFHAGALLKRLGLRRRAPEAVSGFWTPPRGTP